MDIRKGRKCSLMCIKCKKPGFYYINPSKYHSVCIDCSYNLQEAKHDCIHCGSTVYV